VKLSPLTPTLSHDGERENKVKNDYTEPRPTKSSKRLFARLYNSYPNIHYIPTADHIKTF